MDSASKFRDTGGDEFDVIVESMESGVKIPTELTDMEDGKYMITYVIPDEDEYEVSVVFKGTYGGKAGHLRARTRLRWRRVHQRQEHDDRGSRLGGHTQGIADL